MFAHAVKVYLWSKGLRNKVVVRSFFSHIIVIFQGLKVAEDLWNIALFTQETTLCNSIIEELLSGSSLSGEQISMVKFYKELNELYPCRNFEDIQNKHPHVKDR
jgi:hypothetical protein